MKKTFTLFLFVLFFSMAGIIYAQIITIRQLPTFRYNFVASTNDNLVISLNPTSVVGGTEIYNKTLPIQLDGAIINIRVGGSKTE